MLSERIERRHDSRIRTELEVSYYVRHDSHDSQDSYDSQDVPVSKGMLTELGDGGARLLLSEAQCADARLVVSGIYDDGRPVQCDVRWMRKTAAWGYDVGVVFSGMSDSC